MAFELAKQYVTIEVEMWKVVEMRDQDKQQYGKDSDEYTWSKHQVRKLRAKMDTIQESKTLIGISSKMWSDQMWQAYLDNSEKEKALA